MNQVLIRCKSSLLDVIKSRGYVHRKGEYNPNEIEVIVNDIENLNEDELCNHYHLDYNQVNFVDSIV